MIKPKISKEIIELSTGLESYLGDIQRECDVFDRKNHIFQEQKIYISKISKEFFSTLDSHFDKLWKIIKYLPSEEYKECQGFYQAKIVPFFILSPLNKRIYEKPLGYDGDYLTLSYYYDNGFEGQTTFGKLMHRYTLSIPLSKAVMNRLNYFENFLKDEQTSFSPEFSITSVGSGPGKEIINYVSLIHGSNKKILFNCIDFEKAALEQLGNEIGQKNVKSNYNFNFIFSPISRFIKKCSEINDGSQHFIYSFGLYDYLTERTAKHLTGKLINLLKINGVLVISNFMPNVSHLGFLDFLGNWKLKLRNEQDMLSLVSPFKVDSIRLKIDRNTKNNAYLIVRK